MVLGKCGKKKMQNMNPLKNIGVVLLSSVYRSEMYIWLYSSFPLILKEEIISSLKDYLFSFTLNVSHVIG